MPEFLAVVRVTDVAEDEVYEEHYRREAADFVAAATMFTEQVAGLNAFDVEHYGVNADKHVLHSIELAS